MATTKVFIDVEEDLDVSDREDSDFSFDEYNKQNIPPFGTKKKSNGIKQPPSKLTNSKSVLAPKSVNRMDTTDAPNAGKQKTVEETYQKKTQLEHILLRPDTYIGSVERITQPMYVWDTENIVEKEITYTPGLYKIFDEILVNAADNKQRDPNMDKIDITISASENMISVKNNGNGIPIVMHKEHNCYVPTLIFGHLLTGSNFDDEEKKTTGGRNGYGAKLANIFSKSFIIDCVDCKGGLKFRQVFRENMTIAEEPIIRKCTASEIKQGDFVSITFSPDLARFKMTSLDEDTVSLLSKRAYDIAGSMSGRPGKKLAVSLNGNKLPIKNFQMYLSLYKGIEPPAAYDHDGDRWEVGVSASDGTFQQISFVNAICTSKGGQHVQYIVDQVTKRILATVNKKNKGGIQVKENQLRNHLCIFVNCLIENPAFDSQTKENLTTRKVAFGSTFELSEKFLKQVEKSGVVEKIIAFAQFKQKQALQKQGGTKKKRLIGIAKLDDANFAGSAKSHECTLILTEGDSAKSLAMSGLSVVGRDYYGVFPLKGKPLNVRDATHTQIMQNEELKNVTEILGLKYGVTYDESNIKTLRYGHIMIMADQDHDGSHIKGLIINFFHHFWPSLLDVPRFLEQFITPIVKASKGNRTITFFTIPEYETWKNSIGNKEHGWSVKYYKGLGTSTSAEAKDYFSNLDLHEIEFSRLSEDKVQDISTNDIVVSNNDAGISQKLMNRTGSDLIQMAFSKKQVEDRKIWINALQKDTYFDYRIAQQNGAKYSDFINKELVLFSQYDNQRSIPHVFDGMKPSQRKVMFACFLRNLKTEMKVAQLCGYVSEKAAYHHGEQSLQGTIVNLAQDFVGSNNINLLTPAGQFGTRRMGGKDAASARYIHTKLEKLSRLIFHPDDDALLKYLDDDGVSIEPEFYMPVIPMCLVNGSEGIGTGWSTNIPNFNPREIIQNIRRLIKNEEPVKMAPFFYGFTGKIEEDPKKPGSYTVWGKIERIDENTLIVTELPVRKWTQDYKEMLESMMTVDVKKEEKDKKKDDSKDEEQKEKTENKKEPDIKDFKENHTDTTVSFTITTTKEKIDSFEQEKGGLYSKFKLTSTLNTTNMNLFDENYRIVKYDSPEAVLKDFFHSRLSYYVKRKEHLLNIMRRELKMISNKARFVEEVCNGTIIVSNRQRSLLLSELKQRGYDLFPKEISKGKDNVNAEDSDDDKVNETSSDAELAKGYEYLLGMKLWILTFEKAQELRNQLDGKKKEVSNLEATHPSDIWENDLRAIEIALNERDQFYKTAAEEEINAQMKNSKRRAGKTKASKSKVKGSDDESDDDFDISTKKAPAKKMMKMKPAFVPKAAIDNSELLTQKSSLTQTKLTFQREEPEAKSYSAPSEAPKKKDIVVGKNDSNKIVNKNCDAEVPLAARMKKKVKSIPVNTASSQTKDNTSNAVGKNDSIEIIDENSDSEVPLLDRMKTKKDSTVTLVNSDSEKSKGGNSSAASIKRDKRPASHECEDDLIGSFDTHKFEPASLTPAPKKARKTTAKPSAVVKSQVEKKARKPGRQMRKAAIESDSDDDMFEVNSISDEKLKEPAIRSRSVRERKPVKYAIDVDDSDSDFE